MNPSPDTSSLYINHPKFKHDLIQGYAPRPCPHRLKLMSFLDTHEDQRFDDPFVKHLEACSPCRQAYLEMGREFEQLNRILPWIKASPHDLEVWKKKIHRHAQAKNHALESFDLKVFGLELWLHLREPRWFLALSFALIISVYLIYS